MISDNITIKYAFFSLHSLPFIPFPRLFVSLYSRAACVASPSCVLVSIKSRIRSEYFQKEEQLIDEECNKRWALRLWFLNLKHCCCCQTKSGTIPPLEFRTKSPKWLQLMSDEYLCFKIKFFCVLMSDILFIVWKPISCILKSDKDNILFQNLIPLYSDGRQTLFWLINDLLFLTVVSESLQFLN